MKKRFLCLCLLILTLGCGCNKICPHSYASECDEFCNLCHLRREVEHNMGRWNSRGDATCTNDGTKYRICRDCNKQETAIEEGTALGHYFLENSWRFNKDNTHDANGTKTQVCYLCDAFIGETVVAEETTGHNFWISVCGRYIMGSECKYCGWEEPEISSDRTLLYESFERYELDKLYGGSLAYDKDVRLRVYTWTNKTGVDFTVAKNEGYGNVNIRALRVRRDAVSEDANNDAIVDICRREGSDEPYFPSRLIWEFDLMLGSENASDIYLSSRKDVDGVGKYNIFLQYDSHAKQIRVGETAIASDIEAERRYSVALFIDDEERCYDVYIDGECVIEGVAYPNSTYPSAEEQRYPEFYRITAMKGRETVDFYLDNISLSVWG